MEESLRSAAVLLLLLMAPIQTVLAKMIHCRCTEILYYVLSWVAKDQDKDQDQIWRGWVAELTVILIFTLFALQIPAIMYAEEQSGWLPTIITTFHNVIHSRIVLNVTC